MLGHKWESAQGTIVEAHSGPAGGHGIGAALHPEHRYVIEVRKPTGEVIRGDVTEKSAFVHAVGTAIGVEVHSKTGEIRLDPNARTDSVGGMLMAEQMRGAMGAPGAAAGGAAGMAGLAGALGAAGPGGAYLHVFGPGGQDLPVHMEPGEIRNLAQAIRSGDPAARQAAMDRLRELRDHARDRASQQQPGGGAASPPAGFSGAAGPSTFDDIGAAGPSTFDDIGAAGHQVAPGAAFSEPGGFSSFAEPGGFASAGQPSPVNPYPPAPSSFSAFDTGGGQGTKDERIARLGQLLDKGILTESEFQAQRQQILGSP